MSPPESDAEMRKSLSAIGLAKDSMVVLDNAVGAIDFPSLDAVLTSREFRTRRLGANTADANMHIWFDAVIFITGSNLRFPTKSIARWTLRIRITTAERHPERRKVFKHGMGLLDHSVPHADSRPRRLADADFLFLRHQGSTRRQLNSRAANIKTPRLASVRPQSPTYVSSFRTAPRRTGRAHQRQAPSRREAASPCDQPAPCPCCRSP